MWRTEVRELGEGVGRRREARWWTVAFGQECQSVVDDIVGECPAVWVLRRFGRVEGQPVSAVVVINSGDRPTSVRNKLAASESLLDR
jgi:hypothetical protein